MKCEYCQGNGSTVHALGEETCRRCNGNGYISAAPTQGADGESLRPVAIDKREQFEAHWCRDVPSIYRVAALAEIRAIRDKERYKRDEIQWAWEAWQAALATRDAAPSDALKEDAKRLKQLEHALVCVAHSMHSEPQYMLAEGITLGDVSFVRVKIADIDVSVELPESVARAMYDAAMQATVTKNEERRIAIAASAPREGT